MTTALHFLLAAKRCEIDGLRELALTSEGADLAAQLIHGLQRERGLSNLWLGSGGGRGGDARLAQLADNDASEAAWRAHVQRLDTAGLSGPHGARLFSRLALALQGLDALRPLRAQVQALALDPPAATAAFSRVIAALLAVVFEAADSASDPDLSRRLVALFHFMQGKEFAGQERAAGSALFASGRADPVGQQRLLHLIDSQERSLEAFGAFADEETRAVWAQAESGAPLARLERLRRLLATAGGGAPLDAELSPAWFETCSQRMDRMRTVEARLAGALRAACDARLAAVNDEAQSYERLAATGTPPADPLSFFRDAPAPDGVDNAGRGGPLQDSVLALAQDQARRLQAMGEELAAVRASLNERKLIERAKGLLMAHRGLSEADAHKTLRQMAMNQNRRLIDVAEAVLAMADVLTPGPR